MNSLAVVEFETMQRMSIALYKSGYFADVKSEAQAIVKVMAGAELGLAPFASMTGIHIINGKPTLSANLIATLVKNDPRYDFGVPVCNNELCQVVWFENGKDVGDSSFTIEEAKQANLTGKAVWKQYPSDMLFARAITRGARRFAPGIFGGAPVYTPEELGADTDQDGNIVEGEIVPEPSKNSQPPEPTPEPAPAAIEIPDDVDTNDLLMGKVEQPEPEPRKVEAADLDSKIADARAWLLEKVRDDKVGLTVVAGALGMAGFTPDDAEGKGNKKHVENWLNGPECKDLRDSGLKVDFRANVSKKGAITIFDRATARKVATE